MTFFIVTAVKTSDITVQYQFSLASLSFAGIMSQSFVSQLAMPTARPPLLSSGQEFLARDPEVPGSIPGATFSDK
jgi:hypothetical protein